MKRRLAFFSLKVLVSAGLLAFLFFRIDFLQLLQILRSAHLSYLVFALVGYLIGQLLSSVRWALLARPLGFAGSLKEFASLYFIGMFFNLFAPSTVGGDVSRVFYLARAGKQEGGEDWKSAAAHALICVISDRAVGMIVLTWLGAVALVAFPIYALPSMVRYPTFALALVSVLGWALLPFLSRFLQERRNRWGHHLQLALETYGRRWTIIVQTLALSCLVHLIQASMQLFLGWSMGVDLPWSYAFILYPLVGVFSALPISLNGFGLREGSYLFLLQWIGVDSEKAVAFGLLWFIIVALDSLIGGVIFIMRKSPRPSAVPSGEGSG